MDHHASGLSSELELLTAQLQDLERRVSALERGEKQSVPGAALPTVFLAREITQTEKIESSQPASLVAIVGKAILGIAGAYLLRAAAESEVIPKLVVVIAALVYAWIWQFLAVHATKSSRSAGAAYGITSALILYPMLWESTLRFHILSASVTAGILFASVLSAMILDWEKKSAGTLWAAVIFSSVTALGLFVATRDPLPFAAALILTAILTEVAACRGRWRGLRIVASVALNMALCALLYLITLPGGFPSEYKSISIPALLVLFTTPPLISASAAGYRTIRLRQHVAWLDVCQTSVTFVLLLAAVLVLGGSAEIKAFGIFCFLSTAVCYLAIFFNKEIQEDFRNFQFCAAWAGALFLIGSYLVFHAPVLTALLSLSAILATVLAPRTKRVTLGFHGFVWLIAAQISSGLMAYASREFAAGYLPVVPPMAWSVALSATACSLILLLRESEAEGIHVLRFCSVANASFLLGAFSVSGVLAVLRGGGPASAPRLALIRTVVICVMTLVLAVSGARWRRRELILTAYAAIGAGTLKLLLEDWRFGSTGSFALSLLAFGVLLAVIPRLVRGGSREREIAASK